MSWFEALTGFAESADAVRRNLVVDGPTLRSTVNGSETTAGVLTTPSLGELRAACPDRKGAVTIRELIGDVRALHADPDHAGAFFQAASQFNLLEMTSPSVTPERGVTGYEHDHTQGPTCAIACGGGTIVRNWFADVGGRTGQSATRQIDCLADLGAALGNDDGSLWEMQNGYCMATAAGLDRIAAHLAELDAEGVDELRALLRIGIQADTEVTIAPTGHLVTQAYCSAVPVAYSPHTAAQWEPFARLVLEASYEATLCAAAANAAATGNNTVFLTTVGGGVFGNHMEWIVAAIERAAERCSTADLDLAIVSYRSSNPDVARLVERWGLRGSER